MKRATIAPRSSRKRAQVAASEPIRDDATATIAASVPRSIIAAVKEYSGSRGFSRFVTAALERKLRHVARAQLIEDIVQHTGPLHEFPVKE